MNDKNIMTIINISRISILFSLFAILNMNTIKGMPYNDSIIVMNKFKKLESDILEINKWKNSQESFTELANQRIRDNFSLLDRISSSTSTWIAIITLIITAMNVLLFIWIFVVQRNLSRETREINAETKESKRNLDKKSEELNQKTEELYKQMLDSKYGYYNKKIRDEIVHEDESQDFDKLETFQKKVFRADKELDENNVRDAISHFKKLLKENKDRDYIYNRIGIGYVKIGASEKALDFFKKAFDETPNNKKRYALNLLERYIVLNKNSEALQLIDECEKLQFDTNSLPTFFVLKFALYAKMNNKQKIEALKREQINIDWDCDSKWEFKDLRNCFKNNFINDFHEVYRFANIIKN